MLKVDSYEFETIEASDGLQAVIDKLNLLARSGLYVFRGYGNQEELLPNIIREKDFSDVEMTLLDPKMYRHTQCLSSPRTVRRMQATNTPATV